MSATTQEMLARPVTADPATLEAYFAQTRSFSRDRLRSAQRMTSIAWTVAVGACLVAGGASLAVAKLALRPIPDPVVLRVDNASGRVDRVFYVDGGTMEYGEAVQRYWVWQFVEHAESYDFPNAKRNFDEATLMMAPSVQAEYFDRTKGSNPLSPQVVLGRDGQAVVNYDGIDLPKDQPGVAYVRYVEIDQKAGSPLPRRHMKATVRFTFSHGRISESAINVNPLGFLVTSYRVEQDAAP